MSSEANRLLKLFRAAGILVIGAISVVAQIEKTIPQTDNATAPALVTAGMAAYGNKDYKEASRLLQLAVSRGADQVDVFYNTACASSLAGDRDGAFKFVYLAIHRGYRNAIHLKTDVDLNSLHDDPRWTKAVEACEEAQARFLKERSDPSNAKFITSDVIRFWSAYDKAMAAPVQDRAAILQREYIDPGTVGLKDFAASGRLNAKALAQRIETHQAFYKSIRPVTLAVESQKPQTMAAFRKLKELFDFAMFPDVYFIVGQLQSGGTASSNGLLMGAEMFTRVPEIPDAELSDWQKGAIAPPSDIPALIAHESIHFQQKFVSQGTLLCSCLVEGGADFVGMLASGRVIKRMEDVHRWANARERELWDEFKKEMDGKDTSHWLYGNSGGNGRPVDLGYWMGFKISEAYYRNAADKKQALKDLMLVFDCRQVLERSRYAEKFADVTTPRK